MEIKYLIRELEKLLNGKIGDSVAINVFKLENDNMIPVFEMDHNEVIVDTGLNFEDIKELECDSFEIDEDYYDNIDDSFVKKCIWIKVKDNLKW